MYSYVNEWPKCLVLPVNVRRWQKRKISHIVHGTILEGQQDSLTTIRNLLCSSYPTSRTVKKNFESQLLIKKEQAEFLIQYCNSHHLFLSTLLVKEQ